MACVRILIHDQSKLVILFTVHRSDPQFIIHLGVIFPSYKRKFSALEVLLTAVLCSCSNSSTVEVVVKQRSRCSCINRSPGEFVLKAMLLNLFKKQLKLIEWQ